MHKTISIVVPFYNEGKSVKKFYERVLPILNQNVFENIVIDFEIICIDDGSEDNTLSQLIFIAQKDVRFRIIEFSRNFGKEMALTAGLDAATGDAVIPIDADLQDPPELISSMITEWLNGAEVVLARRSQRTSDLFLKRKTAEIFYRVYNWLSDIKLPENVGDFRLIDRIVIEALKQLPERHRFMKGLFAWVGFKTVTLDYVRAPRISDKTKFSGWKLWNFAIEGITSFSTMPLKNWSYIGLIGALSTFLYALFIVFKTIVLGVDLPGYASLIVAILFLGSIQLISIGMLGEYIARIYMETKQRPLYIVRKKYEFGAEQRNISIGNDI